MMTDHTVDNLRVLIVSHRNISHHVSQCLVSEFEDIVHAVDTVDLVVPNYSLSDLSYRLANKLIRTTGISKFPYAGANSFVASKTYNLFFTHFQYPKDIILLNNIKGWRKKCDIAVCWLEEIWIRDIEHWKHYLKPLKDFDYIFISFSSSVNPVANVVQRPCHYMPYGIDAIRFCPYPPLPPRSIDLYNMGRRSPIIHKVLLDLAEQKHFFYFYEESKILYPVSNQEHRNLVCNLIKRSRYFITNKAKFDDINSIGGQEELGPRFFEGAAGGAVLLGIPPACNSYYKNFDWTDAVIRLPYDAYNIADIIADLDSQPERLAIARRNNIINSLLRHDWVYRWRQILEVVGLEPTPQMVSREAQLINLAEQVKLLELATLN